MVCQLIVLCGNVEFDQIMMMSIVLVDDDTKVIW